MHDVFINGPLDFEKFTILRVGGGGDLEPERIEESDSS